MWEIYRIYENTVSGGGGECKVIESWKAMFEKACQVRRSTCFTSIVSIQMVNLVLLDNIQRYKTIEHYIVI